MDGTAVDDSAVRVVSKEQYGLTSLKRDYLLSDPYSGHLQQRNRSSRHTSLLQVFRTVFLPQGYPESVSEDYLQYQIWDTVQAFASSLSGTLATHSLLKGIGVGDESATVLAATLTWLWKDGTGMVGRILFAWWKGTQLDCDAKRWRLFADVLNDFAFCLEILAQHTQTYFRVVVCVAGICKSLVGVAGGCTRAALTQHQARRNNMADVSAKDGSQETVVNLAALVSSLFMMPLVSGHLTITWTLFVLLTTLHIFANYRAVRAVRMESLNQARLQIIMSHYLLTGTVPSVAAVNAREPVFWGLGPRGLKTDLGVSVSSISTSWVILGHAYQGLPSTYLLSLCRRGPAPKVVVVLSPDSGTSDQLQACVHAELLKFLLSGGRLSPEVMKAVDGDLTVSSNDGQLLRSTFQATRLMFPHLLGAVRAQGWQPDHCLLGADEWRATWDLNFLPSEERKGI